ncbi:GntR family transcriptional regulator [Cryobacterium sp. TMS1-20-1]|uniref:GntR family transcriptional regulator n=3 Tax=Cryobacterium TaxID=69578 RepID=A0A4R9AVH5_9MICO|nr:GntR family transcriptional regulator [Cryobacterium sp. TMS1-20-1]TFD49387.1 GntR family transcriptional regulator [Cryobacterium sp. Hh11]TFD56486.1 GntR family transcriptional regulator [Cryobacterium sp. Hh38]TFD63705.1 GntR family transcriptional regulator [Cryobacterium sp. Hb1]TFD66319.1 GntR family transcriptional regulator [Cryobacterium ruanii]TFD70622.1 GntR family transcriptional regulator [Cryobacterium gelidum]TFD89796.1 GntR family transcriptional regulator [Cryobacterium se
MRACGHAEGRRPLVRQLAEDLDVAPGTVAKAYKVLESEGYLTARTGGVTRVSRSTTTSLPVLEAPRQLAKTSTRAGTSLDGTIRILRAISHEEYSEPGLT